MRHCADYVNSGLQSDGYSNNAGHCGQQRFCTLWIVFNLSKPDAAAQFGSGQDWDNDLHERTTENDDSSWYVSHDVLHNSSCRELISTGQRVRYVSR